MLTKEATPDLAHRSGRFSALLKEGLPFFAGVVWFSVFLSHNLSVAHDSMRFLLRTVGGELWHANHLFTLPVMSVFVNAGEFLNLPLSPLELATIPNILGGAAMLQLVYLYLRRRLGMSYRDSLLGSLLPAVSFGTWYYSASIEAYAVPICLLLLCIYLLADDRRTEKTFWLVAVVHSAAALFHQFAVLLGPLVVYAMWTAPVIANRRKGIVFVTYVAITAFLVGGTYIAVGLGTHDFNTVAEFLTWLLGNAGADGASQFVGSFELKTLMMAFVGFARSLIGGHFAFAVPELDGLLSKVFGAASLDDERFLVQSLSPMMARVLLALSLLWGLTLLFALFRSVSSFREALNSQAIVMLLWVLLPLTLLFMFYFGHNVELWLMQSVCFWMIVGWALSRARATGLLVTLLVGLLLINVLGSMQFVRSSDYDFHQWRLQPIVEASDADDLIVVGDWWPTESFVQYFAGTDPLVLSRSYQDKVAVEVLIGQVTEQLATGGRVFIYDDIYELDSSAVSFYGRDFARYVDQFRQAIPSAPPMDAHASRQHRLLTNN